MVGGGLEQDHRHQEALPTTLVFVLERGKTDTVIHAVGPFLARLPAVVASLANLDRDHAPVAGDFSPSLGLLQAFTSS